MSLPPYDQSVRDFERQFQVVLPDSVGQAAVGFRDGVWYRLNSGSPHPVPIRSAIILCPHAAGSIVQIVCWWMRENPRTPRALDLATELALTVGELARKAIEDDPLGMSITTLPPGPSQSSSAALGAGGLGAGASPLGGGGYDSGSFATDPYAAVPPSAPSPYQPAYAAATTLLPQITPEMGAPGRLPPRPNGAMPGLPALPPPGPGRPGPAGPGMGQGSMGPGPVGPGFGAPRAQGAPGGRGPMGPGGSGNWDRPNGYDPRGGRPAGGPPPRQPGGYDAPDQRDEFFRGAPPQQQRRPEPVDYPSGRPAPGRPGQARPANDRAW